MGEALRLRLFHDSPTSVGRQFGRDHALTKGVVAGLVALT